MNPFIRFLAKRLGFLFVTFFAFILIIFALPRAIPGNPLSSLLYRLFQQSQANPELIRAVYKKLMEEFGVGQPLHLQFGDFLLRTLRGDLGTSISFYPRKVAAMVFVYLPWSLGLLIPSTIISWIVGNLMGAFAGYRRKTKVDNVLLPVFITLSQTPYYWLAMILLFVFSVNLEIFPLGGAYTTGMAPSLTTVFILDMLHHYVLPFASILVGALGGWAIGMRVMVIYELGSDYVNYADVLGLPDRKILEYVFRNSMLPQVAGLALSAGTILGGALITELVFNYPGTGFLVFRGLSTLDYPLIQGIFVLLISTLLAANFIVDLIYGYVDPRVRTGYVGD